jgi:hypothetical protein
MTFTYVLATDIGKVRLKVGKLETVEATSHFTDEEITEKLTEFVNSINKTAADCLDSKADYIVEKKKVTTIGKYSINGAAMAAELRKRADKLRALAEEEMGDDGTAFDVAPLDEESLI